MHISASYATVLLENFCAVIISILCPIFIQEVPSLNYSEAWLPTLLNAFHFPQYLQGMLTEYLKTDCHCFPPNPSHLTSYQRLHYFFLSHIRPGGLLWPHTLTIHIIQCNISSWFIWINGNVSILISGALQFPTLKLIIIMNTLLQIMFLASKTIS
jgi:hypothetical protein